MGEKRIAFRLLVGKPEGKRPLEDQDRWEDNIKIYLVRVESGGLDRISLAQDKDK
jgi:hypothetical protein